MASILEITLTDIPVSRMILHRSSNSERKICWRSKLRMKDKTAAGIRDRESTGTFGFNFFRRFIFFSGERRQEPREYHPLRRGSTHIRLLKITVQSFSPFSYCPPFSILMEMKLRGGREKFRWVRELCIRTPKQFKSTGR